MQPCHSVRHYPLEDLYGICKSFGKSGPELAWCNFLQLFRPIKSFEGHILSTFPYLWKQHKNYEQIDEEAITAEFARWIGTENLEKEVIKYPQGYEEVIRIRTDFLSSAEKEYYSGFYGFIRSFKDREKIRSQSIIRN